MCRESRALTRMTRAFTQMGRHTVVAHLQACAKQKDLQRGSRIHADIVITGLLEKDVFVGSCLVSMYSKCGSLPKAQAVFDSLPARNVVSWNALISGYAQHGHGEQALDCFGQMQVEGLAPDSVTFTCMLKACVSMGAIDKGQEIHAEIAREGLLGRDVFLGTALVDMYAKCGLLSIAEEVFDSLPIRNVVTWNALIIGYTQHSRAREALECFEHMQHEGLSPDVVTFACILKACGSIGAIEKGQEMHAEIVRGGLLKKHIVVGNALVDMYVKCGMISKAQKVFNEIAHPDVVSWNTLIAGYVQHERGDEALSCYEQMRLKGLSADTATFVSILKACSSTGATYKGEEIHAEIARAGLLEKQDVLSTALIDMYGKCGFLSKAQQVFDKLPIKNVISWSALITGYAQHEHGEQALKSFEQMLQMGISPNAVTLICILKACGSVGAAHKGQEVHAEIVRAKLMENDIFVGNALVDMYAKCGWLGKAQEVFDSLPARDVISWNALIAGYALLGKAENAFLLFNKMIGEGVNPNSITFTCVLSACCHTGLLTGGQICFEAVLTGYGIIPTLEHYTCIVDLFGRAGHLDKVVVMIKEMPFCADLSMWHTILGACRKWRNVKLGKLAFQHALQLDISSAAAYVCMSNIYLDAGMQEHADKVEAMRVKSQAWRKPEKCWWTDENGRHTAGLYGMSEDS